MSVKPPFPRFNRRDLLRLAAPALAVPLVGWKHDASAAEQQPAAVTAPNCILRPQQTEGPYFIDERLRRSDIRSDSESGRRQDGLPLQLAFRVSRVAGDACSPLPGAIVDVWQCNATGDYSAFRDVNAYFDTRGEDFLRGYQPTDSGGMAEFMTVYPGWYGRRAVHIHFKIRLAGEGRSAHEFTSQLYFDDAVTDLVHTKEPYLSKGQRPSRNENDGIFRRGGDNLVLPLARDDGGYRGTFDIGLELP